MKNDLVRALLSEGRGGNVYVNNAPGLELKKRKITEQDILGCGLVETEAWVDSDFNYYVINDGGDLIDVGLER